MTDQTGENPTEPTADSTAAPPAQPPASPAPPPVAPSAAASTGAAGSSYQFDADRAKAAFRSAHTFDLGIMAAGLIAFLAGFMPFYTLSVDLGAFGGGSGSWSAWHGFFGWFGVLCALAGAVVVALSVFTQVALPLPVFQAAAGAFGAATICLILALFVNPLPSCGGVPGCSRGHGFGFWLALILVLVGLGLSVIRMRESTTAKAATV